MRLQGRFIPNFTRAQALSIKFYSMEKKLAGKIALITGSDSGIGQAIAIAYAGQGAKVIITYHSDKDGAEETKKEVKKAGSDGIVLAVDVRNETEVEEMFDKALEEFGDLHILVNNAAVNGAGIKLADMSTEQWNKTIQTNLTGYFFCCRRFINIRKEKGGGGKIINISSVHEEIPMVGAADYDCTKGAIRNMTRTLVLEVSEDKINVNNIAPGMILTPFNQKAVDDEETRKKQVQNIPLKRAGNPEEVAAVAVFLASKEADYVTGSTYVIDGGLMQAVGQGA